MKMDRKAPNSATTSKRDDLFDPGKFNKNYSYIVPALRYCNHFIPISYRRSDIVTIFFRYRTDCIQISYRRSDIVPILFRYRTDVQISYRFYSDIVPTFRYRTDFIQISYRHSDILMFRQRDVKRCRAHSRFPGTQSLRTFAMMMGMSCPQSAPTWQQSLTLIRPGTSTRHSLPYLCLCLSFNR
jgi:hypothetical protein